MGVPTRLVQAVARNQEAVNALSVVFSFSNGRVIGMNITPDMAPQTLANLLQRTAEQMRYEVNTGAL